MANESNLKPMQRKLLSNAENIVEAIVKKYQEEYTRRRGDGETHDQITQEISTDIYHGCDEESIVGRIFINFTDAIWDAVCINLASDYQEPEPKEEIRQCF